MSVCMFIYIYTSERPHELAVIVIECICNRSGRRHMYISITMQVYMHIYQYMYIYIHI